MSKSQVIFHKTLPPSSLLGEELLVIFDKTLLKVSPEFSRWIRGIEHVYSVQAGEKLKSVEDFAGHIKALTKISEKLSARKLTIVVVGGGSVGDFGGFVASIFKRGVRLVHIPSTWLAAIDSAHGGKTGLNVGGMKNQIGTFYPSAQTWIIKSLLITQPESRAFEAYSELIKIALIIGGSFWKKISGERNVDSDLIWKYLPQAIRGKQSVVAKDPQEKTGLRHVLNLGHTVGHILETQYELPHGVAINYGLTFALEWSAERGVMTSRESESLFAKPVMGFTLSASRDGLFKNNASLMKQFKKLLLGDKKKTTGSKMRFVFLAKPGKFVIQEVSADEILKEISRQQKAENI
jgi:3-dehydroquinate synthetase